MNFEDFEDEAPSTCESRYHERVEKFVQDGTPNPRLRHHLLWLAHNCVAHPLLGVLPNMRTVELHTVTSNWLNKNRAMRDLVPMFTEMRLKEIPSKPDKWWVFHNVVAHVAIGLAPIKPCFDFHDWSAKKMDVPGWA